MFLLQGVKKCFRIRDEVVHVCDCGAAYNWLCAVTAPWQDNSDGFRLGSVWACLGSSLSNKCHVLRTLEATLEL